MCVLCELSIGRLTLYRINFYHLVLYDSHSLSQKAQFQKSEDVLVVQGSSDSCQSEEVVGDEEEEVGGQGEYESFFIKTLRVFNIQRLSSKTPKLKFLLTATVGTQGTDKVGKVTYEVPLTKHLLNNSY